MIIGLTSGVLIVRTALSPNAGLKHNLLVPGLPSRQRQNSAKPERGIETCQGGYLRYHNSSVRTALSPNAGLKLFVPVALVMPAQCQNSAKPERGIETS